jgi:hypothetical protein
VLRPGNIHSADGWEEFLMPIVDRYRDMDKKLYLRGDAAFASPDMYEYLESRGVLYAIRLNLDAIENPPPGEGLREGAGLEFVKDGGRKAGWIGNAG